MLVEDSKPLSAKMRANGYLQVKPRKQDDRMSVFVLMQRFEEYKRETDCKISSLQEAVCQQNETIAHLLDAV